ncbi:hypothetical protein [Sporolactobacillus putidus]|uniref:hypothetical protein n=1 Tax=Sporolactobacillus putidus TaxID=492735 RepID=UPI0016655C99|nr:hypothetical protein [Sporolactobacillus putidus]
MIELLPDKPYAQKALLKKLQIVSISAHFRFSPLSLVGFVQFNHIKAKAQIPLKKVMISTEQKLFISGTIFCETEFTMNRAYELLKKKSLIA